MEIKRVPEHKTPAVTIFCLSNGEVAEALAEYIAKQGKIMPPGRFRVTPQDKNGITSLFVYHKAETVA